MSAAGSGSGRQYWPWIHRQDWVNLVRFVLRTPDVAGPINATAPAPVTNAEFARELGRTLRTAVVRSGPGVRACDCCSERWRMRCCSRVSARSRAKAERLGFTFAYPTLGAALDAILRR